MPADLNRVPPFYHNYIRNVGDTHLEEALISRPEELLQFLKNIPEDRWSYRYAEGKWSIREMVQHIIDADRIFSYRALCIARGEKANLPGFDENEYVIHSKADQRTKEDLISEWASVLESSRKLFASFDSEQLEATGFANNSSIYVAAIGYIMIGHALHHRNILVERYGI
jgi:uncharacterized damage-inducible protein DinB